MLISSVAHVEICLIGLISITKWGVLGSHLILIIHGFCYSGLFYLAKFSYKRYSSRIDFFLKKA